MHLTPEQMLDQYRLIEPIGEGGMGVVWRARDTTLDRDVAIKVLPVEFVRDADRLARFEREAKAVAALSHPNIVAIHGFGECEGTVYAAIELLQGKSLREHLDEGSLPPRKALDVARQIAVGLDAAHAKGIVHRDLKPENVFLSPGGRARILDFGLAGVADGDEGAAPDRTLATRTALTEPGVVMGSVSYMSPEQVRGEPADSRSDIFSLGLVLHEMLGGARTFARPTAAETMTAILREDPPEPRLGGGPAPPAVSRIVARCLDKSPGERFQSARDLAFALESVAVDSSSSVAVPAGSVVAPEPAKKSSYLPIAAALAVVVLGAFLAVWAFRRQEPPRQVPRTAQLTFSGQDFQPAISPDGSLIAFTSKRNGVSQIWLRQVDGGGEQPLSEGSDWRPVFSPDGSSIAFVRADGDVYSAYRIPLVGGQARKLLEDVIEVGWSPDGRRLAFIRGDTAGKQESFSRVGLFDLETGEERILAQSPDWDYFGVDWSPDGSVVSVTRASLQGAAGQWSIEIIDPDSDERREIDVGEEGLLSRATWSAPGRLIAASAPSTVSGTSMPYRVVSLDVDSGEIRELFWSPYLFPFRGSVIETSQFAVLDDSTIVFDTFQMQQQLYEYDLEQGTVRRLSPSISIDRQPSFHPDGDRVLFTTNRSGNVDLYAYELATEELFQLTDHPGSDWDGAYTPDGESIVWGSDRTGNLEIWTANVDGSRPRQITRDGYDAENPTMTPDGAWVVYSSGNPQHEGILKIRSDGTDMENIVPGNWINPEVSPDGRFAICLTTDQSRMRNSVRVVEIASGEILPFEVEVSYSMLVGNVTYGRARWMPDGSAIVYVGLDEDGNTGLFAQDFHTDRNAPESRREVAGFDGRLIHESFGIAPDGKRIVVSTIEQVRALNQVDRLWGLR
jgi:Tol biopolymer transport system component